MAPSPLEISFSSIYSGCQGVTRPETEPMIGPDENIQRCLRALTDETHISKKPERLRFYLNYLFGPVSFKDKSVLDIGGGCGELSFYAIAAGAANVTCLEPGSDGSRSNILDKFMSLQSRLDNSHLIEYKSLTFQDFDPKSQTFDIVILHNSINHLDECACEQLHNNDKAKATYQAIFSKLSNLCSPCATLHIADCSRKNLYPKLGLKNPFSPSIEWRKHQAPEVWAGLLQQAGFEKPCVRWFSPVTLRHLGRLIFGHPLVAYFYKSHFSLIMSRNQN